MVSHEVPSHTFVIGDESNMSHFKQLFLEDNTATSLLAVVTEIREWSTRSVFSVVILSGGYILIWVNVCGWQVLGDSDSGHGQICVQRDS